LRFFGPIIRTTKALKPIKGSRDADCSLVFLKNETKNCPLRLRPSADTVIQKTLTFPNYDVSHKNSNPNLHTFSKSKLQEFPHF